MRNRTIVLMGVLLALSACGDRPPSPGDVIGTYGADLPAAGPSPARAVTLSLAEGNAADMAVAYDSGGNAYTETGTWSLGPRGEVRVVLARDGLGPVSLPLERRRCGPGPSTASSSKPCSPATASATRRSTAPSPIR